MARIIFFGTPAFATGILEGLVTAGHILVAVVTQPDKPMGRSGSVQPSPVKQWASGHLPAVPLFQPLKASADVFVDELALLKPDFLIVAAFGQILKQNLLDIPKIAAINVHTSLLPKYRGAAPIQRAIMAGESETGVTIMHMVLKLDAGAILKQQRCPILPNMNAGELESSLMALATPLLNNTLKELEQDEAHEQTQEESLVTWAPKIELEETQIHWQRPSAEIHNLIRGVTPEPGAWCLVKIRNKTTRLRIRNTQCLPLENTSLIPGTPIITHSPKGLGVVCGSGVLLLGEVQPEGRKWMTGHSFLNGLKDLAEIQFNFCQI
jgi:methionyl-tRNA formyltransferase